FVDHERSHFRHLAAQARELAAPDDRAVADRDHEARRVLLDVLERARQQVTGAQVRGDERVDGGRVFRDAGSKLNGDRAQCFGSSTAGAIADSGSGRASSISISVITNGGSRRTTVSDVRLTSSRRSRAASTTCAAGRSISMPHMTPAPRTDTTAG